ncbi:MAG TPA: hypothetical protein VNX26_12545 [Candidatus Acidoferrum sp.]|nr:hypothetical protein [Candidatus Acidoferrum sp.]
MADHDNLWCVFCLAPIRDDPPGCDLDYPLGVLELHHPFAQSMFGKKIKEPLLRPSFPLGWTVPAHATCHEEHYSDAFEVAGYVLRWLRSRDRQSREGWAQKSHDQGLYWHSLAMNADTLRRFSAELQPEEKATLIERQLSSAAGIRSRVHPLSESAIYETVPPEHRSRVLYHLANRQANRGHEKAAHSTFKGAEELRRHAAPGEGADRLVLSSMLRRAQVERTVAAGDEALRKARETLGPKQYSFLTAWLLRGWNAITEERSDARESFDLVLANATWASWLYVAEALFGKTCCSMLWESCRKERAYQWLVQAQYIYVMLGLQVTPHTRLPPKLGVPSDASCFPGHVLVSGRFGDFSAEKRRALREEAIGVEGDPDGLYGALQDTLCGRDGSRARVELLQRIL